jgi:hypothetical protein
VHVARLTPQQKEDLVTENLRCILRVVPILALAACGDPEATPRQVEPIPGGGTSGGRISGALTVFVKDADDRPVRGAAILLEAEPELRFEGHTDQNGRADFANEELHGPVALHVFHQSFAAQSLIGIDASVITMAISGHEPRRVPIATAEGTITGWDQMQPIGPSSAQVGFVFAVGREPPVEVGQNIRPGSITKSNPRGVEMDVLLQGNDMFPTYDRYAVNYDLRATALAARAGTLTVDPFGPPVMELTHFGFVRGLDATMGSTVATSIPLTHEIDRAINVKIAGAPGLDELRAMIGVELPNGGERVYLSDNKVGKSATTGKVPVLNGTLAGGAYFAVGLARSENEESTAIATSSMSEISIDGFLVPPGEPSSGGRTISSAPSQGATQHVYTFARGDRLEWTVIIAGDTLGAITLPKVPDGISDPVYGELDLEVRAALIEDTRLDEARFSELSNKTTRTAIHRARLAF